MRVLLDMRAAIEAVSAAARSAGTTVGVLLDLDVGMSRTGVLTADALVALAQTVNDRPALRLDGILCYPGHIWAKPAEQAAPLAAVAATLQEAIDCFDRHRLCRGIVSGGSTPTAFPSHLVPQFTEIRPGTYVFNDMNTVHGGFYTLADCAARIVCTVVTGQVVLDGGTMTFTSERVTVIPNHMCPCINLQDAVWWREADGHLRPLTVDARGRLS